MQVSDWFGILLPVGAGCFMILAALNAGELFDAFVQMFGTMWSGLKSGLRMLTGRPRRKKVRRTPLQIEFNTDMTWPQIRWSIARLEHEMLPWDQHTHDADDCVHPDCNPRFLRKMTTMAWESISTVPVSPKFSSGGLVSEWRSGLDESRFTCPTCGMTSYNSHDVRKKYCGNCHEFFPSDSYRDDLPF